MNPTIEALSAACWVDSTARYALADYLLENQLENNGSYGYGNGSYGGGGGGGGGDTNFLLQVAIMFEIGQIVLVHLGGAYDPLAVCGTVVRLIGVEGAELGPDAVAIHRCNDGRWAELATGDVSFATRVVPAANVRFPRCRNAWTARQIPRVTTP